MAEPPATPAAVFLQPGELFTSATPARVKTVVGSCVAILMRAPQAGMGAMAHCLLPEAGAPAEALPQRLALRFVDTTLELMLRDFLCRGVSCQDLEIKLFGGAGNVFRPGAPPSLYVGRRNVETALSGLAARGLTLAASSVGGTRGRLIEFDTGSGEVWVKTLPELAVNTAGGVG